MEYQNQFFHHSLLLLPASVSAGAATAFWSSRRVAQCRGTMGGRRSFPVEAMVFGMGQDWMPNIGWLKFPMVLDWDSSVLMCRTKVFSHRSWVEGSDRTEKSGCELWTLRRGGNFRCRDWCGCCGMINRGTSPSNTINIPTVEVPSPIFPTARIVVEYTESTQLQFLSGD